MLTKTTMESSPIKLRLDGATTRLGSQTFGPFAISIQAGERVAILGPSGAGKSTLLKLMSREWTPVTGTVAIDGRPLSEWCLQDLSRHRAVLPQSSDVAFGLQTELVIGLGRVGRMHDPLLAQIVVQAAKLAHADHLLERRFDTLSGGEQARVQLARVLAQLWDIREGLILVDEPLAALDPGLQFDMLDSLDAYAQARHHTVIAILHDINHAMLGFDRMLLVKAGALIGDLACSAAAVPALEALYGISLSCVSTCGGDFVISPVRNSSRRSDIRTMTN